jgi:hypothetical protein
MDACVCACVCAYMYVCMCLCYVCNKRVLSQGLGSVAFLPALSTFPVRYVDKEVAVFDFKVTGSCIVAAKVLSS